MEWLPINVPVFAVATWLPIVSSILGTLAAVVLGVLTFARDTSKDRGQEQSAMAQAVAQGQSSINMTYDELVNNLRAEVKRMVDEMTEMRRDHEYELGVCHDQRMQLDLKVGQLTARVAELERQAGSLK